MKKFILGALTVLVIAILIVNTGILNRFNYTDFWNQNTVTKAPQTEKLTFAESNGVKYRVKAEGNSFYFYEKGRWQKQFLRGVNIGAGKPGIFPGELTVSYEEYYHWFEEIAAMNSNCIRVYTTMRPQFYNALLDFNNQSKTPLFIIQGVWMDEADIQSLADVYAQNAKIKNAFTQDAKNVVDVIHGNITLPTRLGFASGNYTADVSDYLAGLMIGIEWDPKFVQNTNDSNLDKNVYNGKYLYTLNASPFETFLSIVGDEVIQYQTNKYAFQAPIAFPNWITTDPLSHPNEPHPDEDMVSVNMENIKSREGFLAKMYLSYHVYPYYPDVLNYEKEYITYTDPYGRINPYRAYLKDLKAIHTMPIIIAEFGIPTSRGMGHESIMSYNQGNVDEAAQGDMLLEMMNSMYEENYAGGLVFTWQDEWFKRTWNNVSFDIPDKRPFWSNIQTNEQNFGILAFDPGAEKSVCQVDGKIDEWKDMTPVITGDTGSLFIKNDERYVYFMVQTQNFDFDKNILYIPIDTLENQGNLALKDSPVTFSKAADFLITVGGKDGTRISVDSYYDSFYYLFGEQKKLITQVADIRTKNSGRFNSMQLCYNYEFVIPDSKVTVPFKSYETGKLLFGVSNPESAEYRSLADFYFLDGNLEFRIPWQLLNVMDPSSLQIMDDLYTMQSIVPTSTTGLAVGFGTAPTDGKPRNIQMDGTYVWSSWLLPTYHERLKPSYKILQNGFLKFK